MKKLILATALSLASVAAFAADGNVCTNQTAAADLRKTVAETASDFAVTNFNFQCSANIWLSYSDSATAIGVGSGSAKGKTAYKGNSAGGAITKDTDCASSGCTQPDATTAATNGLNEAGSS